MPDSETSQQHLSWVGAEATPSLLAAEEKQRRFVLRALSLGAFLLGSTQSMAAPFELRAITSGDSPAQRQILQALNARYASLQASSNINALASRKGPAVYLAIGPSALQAALSAELDGPLVSLFTSSQTYTGMLSASPRARNQRSVTAIYAEPSPSHQMQLIARLYQRRVSVGVLLTTGTTYLEPALRRAARDSNLDLHIELVAPDEHVVRALTRVGSATVLLAVPDSRLYTAENLRNILESAYRRNQPVVGFSPALVKVGTLATAYSSIDDTIAQLDEIVDAAASGRLPEPQFPQYWSVATNDSVARSLNVVIDESVRSLGNRPTARTK